jgi:hypothetical protein
MPGKAEGMRVFRGVKNRGCDDRYALQNRAATVLQHKALVLHRIRVRTAPYSFAELVRWAIAVRIDVMRDQLRGDVEDSIARHEQVRRSAGLAAELTQRALVNSQRHERLPRIPAQHDKSVVDIARR